MRWALVGMVCHVGGPVSISRLLGGGGGQNSVAAFFSPFLLFWWKVCAVSGEEDDPSAVMAWGTTEFSLAIGTSVQQKNRAAIYILLVLARHRQLRCTSFCDPPIVTHIDTNSQGCDLRRW